MALSNVSKDKMLSIENLTNSYTTLYKKDIILVNLLGKNLDNKVIHVCLILFFSQAYQF